LPREGVTPTGVFIGSDIRFIDHLYIQLGTTGYYSAIADLHTSQITTAHAKFSPACCVFTSRSLLTASNSGDSSASALKSSLNGGGCLPTDTFLHRISHRTDLVTPIVSLITPQHGPCRQYTVHSRMPTVSAGTLSPSRFLAAAVYSCLIRICCLVTNTLLFYVSRPLPRNKCFRAVP
jgi:hypothetical protein